MTRAYREKLAERQKWLAEEKRREEEEAANDVSGVGCGVFNHPGLVNEVLSIARSELDVFTKHPYCALQWCGSISREG